MDFSPAITSLLLPLASFIVWRHRLPFADRVAQQICGDNSVSDCADRPSQAGISHLQRLSASITHAIIPEYENDVRFPSSGIEITVRGRKNERVYGGQDQLFEGPAFRSIATVGANDQPHVAPVGFHYNPKENNCPSTCVFSDDEGIPTSGGSGKMSGSNRRAGISCDKEVSLRESFAPSLQQSNLPKR